MTKFNPITKIVAAVDNLTKTVFGLSAAEYSAALNGKFFTAYEGEKYNKTERRKVKAYTKIALKTDSDDKTPLDMFDRAVLAACQSARTSELDAITPAVIYRLLTGKYSNAEYPISPRQIEMVMTSIRKLASTKIALEVSDLSNLLGYKLKFTKTEYRPILPCSIGRGALQGGTSDNLIMFKDESLFAIINSVKNQVATFDTALLDTGNCRHSRAVIAAKYYTACRITETLSKSQETIKSRRESGKPTKNPLPTKILHATILEAVGMTGASDYVKRQICGAANAVANNFNTAGKLNGIIIDCKGSKAGFIEW